MILVLVTLCVTTFEVFLDRGEDPSRSDFLVGFALLLLIILVERTDFSIPLSSGTMRVSVGAPVALAATIHLGVPFGALIVLTGHLMDSALARRDPLKSITNICTFVTAAAIGGYVYAMIANSALSPLDSGENMMGILVASIAFVLSSTLTMAFVVGPILGLAFLDMWRSTLRLSAIEAVTLPTIGGLVVIVARENALATLVIAFPLLGPQLAYRAMLQARKSVQDAMESLNDAVEQRDSYTAFHSVRVRNHVESILNELSDIPYEMMETILSAARVHDVGKVGTRDLTLYKQGPLTPAERQELRRHAEVGAEIVARISEYRLTSIIIRHHHEWWNGTGYPDRLTGEDIPLGSRVISVADAFDAMTSDRPYRSGMSEQMALAELQRNKGTQFDPRIVEAFERVLVRSWESGHVVTAPSIGALGVS